MKPSAFFPKHLADLRGTTALITGASSGLGAEFARQLAAAGVHLVLTARRQARLEELASELRARHKIELHIIALDLSESNGANRLFEQANRLGRPIQLLVNNAGAGRYGPFLRQSWEEQRRIFQLNAGSPTELTYLFLQHMRAHQRPSYVVQIASIAAYQSSANFALYGATKAYLRFLSEPLAYELRGSSTHLICVCPGGTLTEFFTHSGQLITPQGNLTMMRTERVVALSLKAMLARRVTYIPGVLNQLACLLPRFLPGGWAMRLAVRIMRVAVREAPLVDPAEHVGPHY